jgi:hypothetical protein
MTPRPYRKLARLCWSTATAKALKRANPEAIQYQKVKFRTDGRFSRSYRMTLALATSIAPANPRPKIFLSSVMIWWKVAMVSEMKRPGLLGSAPYSTKVPPMA